MSVSNAGAGGVRNLRAIFENKASDQSTSPPSRDRSPNGSISSGHDRPLSKVRASFVAVEKVGEEGSTQPGSGDTLGLKMDGANESTISDERSLGGILKGSPFLDEGEFSTEAMQPSHSNGVADRAAAMVKKMQKGSADDSASSDLNKADGEPEATESDPSRSNPKSSTQDDPSDVGAAKAPTTSRGPVLKPRGGPEKIKGIMESAARARADGQIPVDDGKSKEQTSKNKASRVSSVHEVKPKGGVSKIQGVMDSAKRAREAQGTTTHSSVANGNTSKESGKGPTSTRLPRPSLGVSKLPSAATASTASVAARKEESRPAEAKVADKQATRAPPKVANTTTASSLAKKSSRVSMNTNDGNKPKSAVRPADEGFLARMTRPTASSAQKAHDKVQVSSPPRERQLPNKSLSTKTSRMSLSRADEDKQNEKEDDKENDMDTPPGPAVSQESEAMVESTSAQPAEEASSN